jgi:CARDB
MKSKIIPAFIAGLFILACGPITIYIGQPEPVSTPIIEPTTISLPDLMITSSLISMVDINGNCLAGYELTAALFNQGSAPAPDVIVEELMSGHVIYVGTLESQQSMVLQFPASQNGRYRIMIDPQNQIIESDEANNIVTPPSTLATPPGYCLPGLIRTPTTTPYPLYPLTPTPTLVN